VYAEHAPALLGYVTKLTGDRARAEDIVQETVLRAWRHAERLEADDRPLRPWLFTVAARIVVDEHRARTARPQEVTAELLEVLPAGDRLDRILDHWQILDALGTLSTAHRQAVIETFYRGRSINEAAAALGIPPGTVKSRAYYALRALRLALEERGWTP
jgi:RNA polymerase sigma-70 factor (ECF subfamily)